MQDFSVEGVSQMFSGFNFSRVGTKINYLGKSRKILGNFQKYALKLIEI